MYTENNNGGLLKSIILKLLFIALFIFLLLWLYPMPNTKPFYDAIFNDNINNMKEVAEDYYTVQRLPEEIGEVDKLTLQQMLDMKLLLPFVDKNGEYCDTQKSYVQVTKLENDEYELKVNLSCKDQTDYIIEYLGCHDLCVDGKCETVVSTIEYEFVRDLFKGRKLSTVNLYKYEYTKEEKEAYVIQESVTYYKGKKKVSEDTYKYEYARTKEVPYEDYVDVTYYKGKKKVSDAVYKYEYTRQVSYTDYVDVTYYKGKKKVSEDVYKYKYTRQVPYTDYVDVKYYKGKKKVSDAVYSYEYTRTITTPVAPTCTPYYNQSSCPSGASCSKNEKQIQVQDGYTYGPWITTGSFSSSTPVSTSSTDTSRTVSNGYTYETGTCTKSGSCPSTKIVYHYITQTRTKTAKYKTVTVTTYSYTICTPNAPTVTTETQWFTTNPGGVWKATGNKKVIQSEKWDYTDWVKVLPAGYTKIDEKTVKEAVQKVRTEETWSTEDLTKQGWTKTGEKQLVKAGEWVYTDWVKVLPAGYQQTDKKTVKEEIIKVKTETQWFTTNPGGAWKATGNKQLVKAEEYVYTDWVKELPAGYQQTDKKTVKEKTIKYKKETETQWFTTNPGGDWKATGNKQLVKSGEYVYTDWVKELPEGYQQTDKKTVKENVTKYRTKTETQWSTEDLTKQGWTKTGNKEKIGEKQDYVYTDWVTKLPAGYEQIDKKTETKWSTEKELSGWKATGESRVKED